MEQKVINLRKFDPSLVYINHPDLKNVRIITYDFSKQELIITEITNQELNTESFDVFDINVYPYLCVYYNESNFRQMFEISLNSTKKKIEVKKVNSGISLPDVKIIDRQIS